MSGEPYSNIETAATTGNLGIIGRCEFLLMKLAGMETEF